MALMAAEFLSAGDMAAREWLKRAVSLVVAAAWLLVACGEGGNSSGNRAIVRIGDRAITPADVAQLQQGEPAAPGQAGEVSAPVDSVEAADRAVATLVDRELMVIEAGRRNLDEVPELRQRLAKMARQRLRDRVLQEDVWSSVAVDEAKVRQVYDESDLGWQVWPAHIRSLTEEEAREILAELRGGADFAELARERSIADDAARGGDLREYFGPEGMVPVLREALFEMETGELSEPVRTARGWEVLTVLEKRRLPFNRVREQILRQLRFEASRVKHDSLVAELEERYAVEWPSGGVAAALRAIQDSAAVVDADRPVVVHEEGDIDIGEVVRTCGERAARRLPADSAAVVAHIRRSMLADSLIVQSARDRGWDEDPEFVAWRDERRRELMASELYKREVQERVQVSMEDARGYYEEYPGVFEIPGNLHLTEVLVATEEEAEQILEEARAGSSLQELSRSRSLRRMAGHGYREGGGQNYLAKGAGWHYHFDEDGLLIIPAMQASEYHDLFEEDPARRVVGKIQGPVELKEGWAVFRLEKPIEPEVLPFERVAKYAATQVRRKLEANRFSGFMDSLRTVLSDRVEWLDQDLAVRVWGPAGG